MIVHNGPAIIRPGDWSQVSFSSKMMKITTPGTKSQEDKPPTTIMSFNQVSMACSLNGMKPTVAMGENGIVRAWFERPPGTFATSHRDHMPVLCPTFSNHQIIAAVQI